MSGWIKCSERYPDNGVYVLVYFNEGQAVAFCGDVLDHNKKYMHKYWADEEYACSYGGGEVTHWQPLPPPPSE